MYVQVLIELKSQRLDKTFTYHVPSFFCEQIAIGKRVTVPFGKQTLEGFVLALASSFDGEYLPKDIFSVIDEEPVLNQELLELGQYLKKKTACNLISAYGTMLPAALKTKHGRTITKKMITMVSLHLPYEEAYQACQNDLQRKIVARLKEMPAVKTELSKLSVSALQTLVKKGILILEEQEQYRLPNQKRGISSPKVLTKEQKQVIFKVQQSHGFQPFLLHGVTGSGKTEVYIRLIERVLEEKKEAILLVPEISLTPQVVAQFGSHFGEQIAILHSGLSDGEKFDEWRKIERKEVSIVIGARSAIFAPFTNLGIIIIDEEHSTTYKQENHPRYATIDIALWRAKRYQIPVVLGSATPSIESYTRAKMGIYQLLEMKERVNRSLPQVTLIDMRDEFRKGNRILSQLLLEQIQSRLEKKEQVLLLLNRRGYSTVLSCKNCGYTHKCPNCDIPLTYHKTSQQMKCHYCGYQISRLTKCPTCGDFPLVDLGMGTERLEQHLKETFAHARILRMDNDTTSKKGSHEKMILSFGAGEYDILVGTQMIAKGLDFPNVTLVGVVNGDSSLNIPDFRSAERTFQLLEQVAGRAGRGEKTGLVIIQGFNIDHYSITLAKEHDYSTFYQQEMKLRKKLNYSPYCNLTIIKLKGKKEELLFEEGQKMVVHLKKQQEPSCSILGPSYASIPKINQIYEIQIIIKSKKQQWIREECIFFQEFYRMNTQISFEVDFDPVRM